MTARSAPRRPRQEWVAALVECTREWMRVLKPSGSMFVNLGDKYAGGSQRAAQRSPHAAARTAQRMGAGNAALADRRRAVSTHAGMPAKSLLGLPWRYALACTDQLGLILRRDIIWAKPNGLPESVTDRCRSSHEYLFHLVKQPQVLRGRRRDPRTAPAAAAAPVQSTQAGSSTAADARWHGTRLQDAALELQPAGEAAGVGVVDPLPAADGAPRTSAWTTSPRSRWSCPAGVSWAGRRRGSARLRRRQTARQRHRRRWPSATAT